MARELATATTAVSSLAAVLLVSSQYHLMSAMATLTSVSVQYIHMVTTVI